jgi:hypothetical protein
MIRRIFLALPALLAASGPRRKFYITGGRTEDALGYRDDYNVPPLVAYGTDRLDALANSGMTVWEEAEWHRAEAIFRRTRKPPSSEKK